jgi:hypothetical protein
MKIQAPFAFICWERPGETNWQESQFAQPQAARRARAMDGPSAPLITDLIAYSPPALAFFTSSALYPPTAQTAK